MTNSQSKPLKSPKQDTMTDAAINFGRAFVKLYKDYAATRPAAGASQLAKIKHLEMRALIELIKLSPKSMARATKSHRSQDLNQIRITPYILT